MDDHLTLLLADLQRENQLTLTALAATIGCDMGHLSRVLRGKQQVSRHVLSGMWRAWPEQRDRIALALTKSAEAIGDKEGAA